MDPHPRGILGGTGTGHVRAAGDVALDQWIYTVTVTNETPDVFTEIVIFYAATGVNGVVFLQELNVLPGEVRVFRLGVCGKMLSYVIGFFIGDDMVFRHPPEGQEMTPALASQLNPTDTEPCADSWSIGL